MTRPALEVADVVRQYGAAYLARYGEPMPVDVWNVHNFVLQEQHNNWGADVPPGSSAERGEYVGSTLLHLDLASFAQQVQAFRQWMKERGEQEKPLIVSDFGFLKVKLCFFLASKATSPASPSLS